MIIPQSHTKNIIWNPNFISGHILLIIFVENMKDFNKHKR